MLGDFEQKKGFGKFPILGIEGAGFNLSLTD
jgi:hypothetical protein